MATQMRTKSLKIGAIWSGGTTEWIGNGSLSRDAQELTWIQDLMFHPEAKIGIFTNSYKVEDRQPDFNLVLTLPEDQMPQEYWHMMSDRERNRGKDSRPAPTPAPARGRGEYDQRPRGESGGRTYGGGGTPAPTRSREPYPPRQDKAARPARREEAYDEPESAPPPRSTPRSGRGVPRELPPEDDEIIDPFED